MSATSSQQVEDFQMLSLAFQDVLGVMVAEDQHNVVLGKLTRVMQAFEMDSVVELAEKMRRPDQKRLNAEILSAITSAGSRWFAYPDISNLLYHYVLENLGETATLWLAGCGDGSSAYSLAIDIAEYNREHAPRQVAILATDIFSHDIDQVRSGYYRAATVHVPDEVRSRYFQLRDDLNDAYGDPSGDILQVSSSIRQPVSFEHSDLMAACENRQQLDVIVCPEILVYFSNARRATILERFAEALKPGGILLVAEDQPVISPRFDRVEHPEGVFYRQRSA